MDQRLECAIAKLHEHQDRYSRWVGRYRQAEAAYKRSRSRKNREALDTAAAACDSLLPGVGARHDEIDRLEKVIAAEAAAVAEAAERALQPQLI